MVCSISGLELQTETEHWLNCSYLGALFAFNAEKYLMKTLLNHQNGEEHTKAEFKIQNTRWVLLPK